MKAKFKIISVTQTEGYETLKLSPVCSDKYGPNGENEDNEFARWTPSGSMEITIANPDLIGKYKPGQTFYLQFTPCASK